MGTVHCAGQLLCDQNQELGFTKASNLVRSGWPFTEIQLTYYMLGTTTKLSMLFHVLRSWLHLKEIFFLGLDLTVTEINIKKVRKQENENCKKI